MKMGDPVVRADLKCVRQVPGIVEAVSMTMDDAFRRASRTGGIGNVMRICWSDRDFQVIRRLAVTIVNLNDLLPPKTKVEKWLGAAFIRDNAINSRVLSNRPDAFDGDFRIQKHARLPRLDNSKVANGSA